MRNASRPEFAEYSELTRAAQPFRVDVLPDGHRAIVVPHGELDLATVGELAAEVDALVDRNFEAIVVDLRATSFIDSTGVCLLLGQTARGDARITVIDGPPLVSRVFDLAGVRHVLRFEPAP